MREVKQPALQYMLLHASYSYILEKNDDHDNMFALSKIILQTMANDKIGCFQSQASCVLLPVSANLK